VKRCVLIVDSQWRVEDGDKEEAQGVAQTSCSTQYYKGGNGGGRKVAPVA
jgi:hypothetical protein